MKWSAPLKQTGLVSGTWSSRKIINRSGREGDVRYAKTSCLVIPSLVPDTPQIMPQSYYNPLVLIEVNVSSLAVRRNLENYSLKDTLIFKMKHSVTIIRKTLVSNRISLAEDISLGFKAGQEDEVVCVEGKKRAMKVSPTTEVVFTRSKYVPLEGKSHLHFIVTA